VARLPGSDLAVGIAKGATAPRAEYRYTEKTMNLDISFITLLAFSTDSDWPQFSAGSE